MNKIEHIGIAVSNEEEGIQLFSKLLNKEPYKIEEVEKDGVKTIFYLVGETKIELLVPTKPESPIQKFLDTKGPGIHHIAFGVEGIENEIARLEENHFQVIDKTPRKGADGKNIAFIHPKSTGGVLTELCEDAAK